MTALEPYSSQRDGQGKVPSGTAYVCRNPPHVHNSTAGQYLTCHSRAAAAGLPVELSPSQWPCCGTYLTLSYPQPIDISIIRLLQPGSEVGFVTSHIIRHLITSVIALHHGSQSTMAFLLALPGSRDLCVAFHRGSDPWVVVGLDIRGSPERA